ncbi:MAG: hypothetical protein KME09_01150 [Pleurocapsa minor HA4230-MV1]|jgi:hypothetical protein|nr:hypothetical protein [Pleurocapsa minor HA4230-MV1]
MPPTFLLSVEIRTIEPQSDHHQADSTLTIFCDKHNCCIATGLEQIKAAIIGTIPHLGTNSRHPLLFSVQIKPGNGIDALLDSIEHRQALLPGRRLRQTRIN